MSPAALAAYQEAVVEIFWDGEGLASQVAWVVTAHNPGAVRRGDEDNAAQNALLRAELDRRGIRYCPAVGRNVENTWREDSFALFGCGREVALEVARAFDQDAIFEVPPAVVWAVGQGAPTSP